MYLSDVLLFRDRVPRAATATAMLVHALSQEPMDKVCGTGDYAPLPGGVHEAHAPREARCFRGGVRTRARVLVVILEGE